MPLRSWAAIAGFTLCASGFACRRPEAAISRPPPYTFEMSIAGLELPEEGVELVYDDDVVGKAKPNAPIVRVTLPADVYLVDAKGRLRVRVDGSCGKQEIPLRIPYSDRQEETQALRYASAKPALFEADNPTVVRVYFDNEAGQATTLTVGARTVHVPAGNTGATSVVLGSCATARQVVIGGKRFGDLPAQSGAATSPPAAFVDLVGGRCYRRRVHLYKEDGSEKKFDRPAAKAAPKPAPKGAAAPPPSEPSTLVQPEETVLKGDRIYATGRIDDFLVTAPTQLVIHEDPKMLNRTELLRCDSDKKISASPPPPTAATKTAAAPPKPKAPPPKPAASPPKKK